MGYRLTERDLELLAFLAEHRLALPTHVAVLLGTSTAAATTRLNKLADAGMLKRQPAFPGEPRWYQITRRGLAVIGSSLAGASGRPARLRARRRRRLAVAGRPRRNVRSARARSSASAGFARATAPASRTPSRWRSGSAGSVHTAASGCTIRTWSSDRRRAADRARARADAEEPDPPRDDPRRLRRRSAVRRRRLSRRGPAVARSVQAAARRLGISELVHIQRVRVDRVPNASAAAPQRGAHGDEPARRPRPPRRSGEAARAIAALRRYAGARRVRAR